MKFVDTERKYTVTKPKACQRQRYGSIWRVERAIFSVCASQCFLATFYGDKLNPFKYLVIDSAEEDCLVWTAFIFVNTLFGKILCLLNPRDKQQKKEQSLYSPVLSWHHEKREVKPEVKCMRQLESHPMHFDKMKFSLFWSPLNSTNLFTNNLLSPSFFFRLHSRAETNLRVD